MHGEERVKCLFLTKRMLIVQMEDNYTGKNFTNILPKCQFQYYKEKKSILINISS